MRIEFDAVRAALRRASRRSPRIETETTLIQTGIGRDAIVRTLARALQSPASSSTAPAPHLVILAGACGGLAPTAELPRIARIIDQHQHTWPCGEHWTPIAPFTGKPAADISSGDDDRSHTDQHASPVTLIAVDTIIATPQDKQFLHRATGASIVDMESHAFIAECERIAAQQRRPLAWSVVRAVSDTPDETLPAQLIDWIDADGNTRARRAVRDMLLTPSLIGHIIPVVRRSNRVLPKCGDRVAHICERWLRTHAPQPQSLSDARVHV